ncbi:hypothetical protein V8E52_004588 [Russula decolorans]
MIENPYIKYLLAPVLMGLLPFAILCWHGHMGACFSATPPRIFIFPKRNGMSTRRKRKCINLCVIFKFSTWFVGVVIKRRVSTRHLR